MLVGGGTETTYFTFFSRVARVYVSYAELWPEFWPPALGFIRQASGRHLVGFRLVP